MRRPSPCPPRSWSPRRRRKVSRCCRWNSRACRSGRPRRCVARRLEHVDVELALSRNVSLGDRHEGRGARVVPLGGVADRHRAAAACPAIRTRAPAPVIHPRRSCRPWASSRRCRQSGLHRKCPAPGVIAAPGKPPVPHTAPTIAAEPEAPATGVIPTGPVAMPSLPSLHPSSAIAASAARPDEDVTHASSAQPTMLLLRITPPRALKETTTPNPGERVLDGPTTRAMSVVLRAQARSLCPANQQGMPTTSQTIKESHGFKASCLHRLQPLDQHARRRRSGRARSGDARSGASATSICTARPIVGGRPRRSWPAGAGC